MMLRRRITTASTALLGRCLLPTTPRPSTSITTIVRRYASEVPPPHGKSKLTPEQKQKNRKIGMWAVAIILATLGASYASVPLYRMFCRATGYGGTVKKSDKLKTISYPTDKPKVVKPITVNFNSDISDKLAWEFKPLQMSMTVIPGEPALACYLATNTTNEHVIGVATYNITPQRAGAYFNKIQCFCFEEQRLKPGETVEMPVWFFIDPEFENDPNVSAIRTLTLSYTFYKSEYFE